MSDASCMNFRRLYHNANLCIERHGHLWDMDTTWLGGSVGNLRDAKMDSEFLSNHDDARRD